MITVVDINQVKSCEPLITEVLFLRMQEALSQGKKILLSLNRRGAMSALVCPDCGWCARCPACDLMMRVHTRPEHFLLCHFCEAKQSVPEKCPKCGSYHLVESGARIQSIFSSVQKIFPDAQTFLIEDLSKVTPRLLASQDIIMGTQKVTTLPITNLGFAAFLLVESDLAVPQYDVEEGMYGQIRHFSTRGYDVILQTRSPKIQLIRDVTTGNFRDFFRRTTSERSQFRLPPFVQMVTIRMSESAESVLRQRINTLASAMIDQAKNSDTVVIFDHLLIERRGGKYVQKILIRSSDMLSFLEPFRKNLVRGRDIEVEWL